MFDHSDHEGVSSGDVLDEELTKLEGLELVDLPDAHVEEVFSLVHRIKERSALLEMKLLAQLERRGSYERDGYLSAASWLATTQRVAPGEARREVSTARALEDTPAVSAAVAKGEVSLSAAEMLMRAREAEGTAFPGSEHLLLEAAKHHSIPELAKVIGYWRQRVSAERRGSLDEELHARRNLFASVTTEGMVRLGGDLDPETGEAFLTAIGAVMDAEARGRTEEDTRTPAQRRCDALGEVSRRFLDSPDRPGVGGERPHVTLTVDASVLGGVDQTSDACELDHTGPVGVDTALRLSCDSTAMRMVLSADSQPLDVGRRTPVVPSSMRRAVIARDRTCRFPGCDRPQAWCDAHHVRHWARGGETSLANLVLLCRRHHRSVHSGRFGLAMVEGEPRFTRPDGSRLETRAPP
jgi:hypothetical protein